MAEKKLWRIWRIARIRQVFFANFYLVQCHVDWRSQPFMRPLNNKRGTSPVCMKAAAAIHSLSITAWVRLFYTRDNHGLYVASMVNLELLPIDESVSEHVVYSYHMAQIFDGGKF